MRRRVSTPRYDRLFRQRRDGALDEIQVMFEGLWPESADELRREAEADLEMAWSVSEITSILRSWANFLRKQPLDPDLEALQVLKPILMDSRSAT